ncbi:MULTISPECIES: DUF4494 domain-containing protein [unclassified Arenibacter]|uniref:DUF4494 domain-containing protein n=1 Tax=unclassified Arenibacter TaxID=2615047 RepID=UPI000E347ED8|nr:MULTISPECIES: DUF4494 domain-containing protein [unclassified Arenibacter]MCM4166018.1 hypothetical protein [Arenibacter sp. A80]RFT54337.1 DUF4494 domain-containing protein [Arenibacter sp. P308M17]
MSQTWYECKVKYRKTHETGEQKVTTESYLLDAISYTEAEARINEEMAAYTSEEFLITNIKVANLSEVHPFENSDRWFKSKVALIAFDENSGKERKTNTYLLVQANDVKEAYDHTIEAMKGTMGDYTIPVISESLIIDVFPYFSGDEGDLDQLEKFNSLKASTPKSNVYNEDLEALDAFENEEAGIVGALEGEEE